MEKYEAIQQYIKQAQIQRSVYVAEVLADFLVTSWKFVVNAADVLLAAARAKTGRNVFTFDA